MSKKIEMLKVRRNKLVRNTKEKCKYCKEN